MPIEEGRCVGMVLIGRRLSADELAAVRADPTAVDALLYGDLDDEAKMPKPELDLDKSWHGIHYLLTGTDSGRSVKAPTQAILGGTETGQDGGYGPPRLLDRDTVRAVATALDALDVKVLRARFDPDAMTAAEIYPDIWSNSTDELDHLMSHYTELRRFYHAAAANGQAVLLAIA
jgi:hypothetical protein